MRTPSGTHALVRGVPRTFHRALRPAETPGSIDVGRAVEQHRSYCDALERLGLILLRLEADDRYPDCAFVEDTVVVLDQLALLTAPGAPSRRGETAAVERLLGDLMPVRAIQAPATLDGGDLLVIGDTVFVGLSTRTNLAASQQLATIAGPAWRVVPVPVHGVLHLKSACTYLGDDVVLCLRNRIDASAFGGLRVIEVPAKEAHAANCLAVNGGVLMPPSAHRTRARIERLGLETIELEMSEFARAGGGLTCCSVILRL